MKKLFIIIAISVLLLGSYVGVEMVTHHHGSSTHSHINGDMQHHHHDQGGVK